MIFCRDRYLQSISAGKKNIISVIKKTGRTRNGEKEWRTVF